MTKPSVTGEIAATAEERCWRGEATVRYCNFDGEKHGIWSSESGLKRNLVGSEASDLCVWSRFFFRQISSKPSQPELGWKKKDRIPAKSPESLVGGTWQWLRERIPARFWGPNSLVSAAEMQLIPCEVLALDFCSKFVELLELSQIPWKIPEVYWQQQEMWFSWLSIGSAPIFSQLKWCQM